MKRVILWSALLLSGVVQAEQRALLVGVGQYVTPNIDLPAIELDLERMHDTLIRMGFADNQIRTLLDSEATSANVIASFGSWLKDGVKSDDRVVFYFTGHGSNIPDADGDEKDGVDEVLITHDMVRGTVKGKRTLLNVVSDDKLATMLAAIPSRNIWVIVDSCHSGTVTRSFSLDNRSLGSEPVFVKSYTWSGMPENKKSMFNTRDVKGGSKLNYVSISAAADNEQAIGTSKGGVFTIGLTEAIKRLSDAGKEITVNELRTETTQYISTKVDKEDAHHPQVAGNPDLAGGKLNIIAAKLATPAGVAAAALAGPNRKRLLDLANVQSRHFDISSAALKYNLDDSLKFAINLPAAGYLNIVTVDAQDNATVVFPNRHQEDNAVKPGAFELPARQMDFEILAAEPLGPTLVVAFLSSEPINFYRETLDSRDKDGNINVDFPTLSHTATRAIRVAQKRKDIYSGQIELEILGNLPSRN
ncbi:MAG: caspase family protein [Steroidobacteraceae bacterium]